MPWVPSKQPYNHQSLITFITQQKDYFWMEALEPLYNVIKQIVLIVSSPVQ